MIFTMVVPNCYSMINATNKQTNKQTNVSTKHGNCETYYKSTAQMQQHRVHPLNEEFSLWQGGEFTPNRAPSLIIESYLDSSQGQEGDHDRPHLLVLFVSLQSRRLELSSEVSLCVCALAVGEYLKLHLSCIVRHSSCIWPFDFTETSKPGVAMRIQKVKWS